MGQKNSALPTFSANVSGSVAFPFKSGAFARWKAIEPTLGSLTEETCEGNAACGVRLELLDETVNAVHGESDTAKLEGVNTAVNRLIRYTPDTDANGANDHWSPPGELLTLGKGDCEDYAILKFAALEKAGISPDQMALIVLRDTRRNLFHAVLVVETEGRRYVLDNARNDVLVDSDIPQYRALYSLGMNKAWIHGYKSGSEMAEGRRMSLDSVQPGSGVPEFF